MRGALRAPLTPDQERYKAGHAGSRNELASFTKTHNHAAGCKGSDKRRCQRYCAACGAGAGQTKNKITGFHGCFSPLIN
jgi:hypothetical protein